MLIKFLNDTEKEIANLRGANLSRANLSHANLSHAYLNHANLSHAYLNGADLGGADLSGADLRGAYLRGADLSRADLSYADLSRAYLRDVDLSGADLRGADLSGADLSRAYLSDADLAQVVATRSIVADGDIVGWKKLADGTICKLKIPEAAKRVGGVVGRKCRAEYALVLEGEGISKRTNFAYSVGAVVTPDSFDFNPLVECSHGIHFFITRQEAEDYQ